MFSEGYKAKATDLSTDCYSSKLKVYSIYLFKIHLFNYSTFNRLWKRHISF